MIGLLCKFVQKLGTENIIGDKAQMKTLPSSQNQLPSLRHSKSSEIMVSMKFCLKLCLKHLHITVLHYTKALVVLNAYVNLIRTVYKNECVNIDF